MGLFSTLKSLFVPHEGNNYRAKALHIHFLTFYLIAAVSLAFIGKQIHSANPNVLGYATDITAQKLFTLTNDERVKDNLPPLTMNDKLSQAAAAKAQDMFTRNYWSHYGPDGTTPWNFILNAGYQYEYAGENLAKNFMFSDGVVKAWMASPTHRENILRKEYTEVGYAIKNGVLNGEETTLVVQMFGKPMAVAADTQPQPTPEPQTYTQQTYTPDMLQNAQVLGNEAPQNTGFSLKNFSFNLNVFFLGFLLVALAVDLFIALRMNVMRMGGKNMAHFIFVSFILVGIFIIAKGAIQ